MRDKRSLSTPTKNKTVKHMVTVHLCLTSTVPILSSVSRFQNGWNTVLHNSLIASLQSCSRVPNWRVRVQVRVLNLQVRVQVRVPQKRDSSRTRVQVPSPSTTTLVSIRLQMPDLVTEKPELPEVNDPQHPWSLGGFYFISAIVYWPNYSCNYSAKRFNRMVSREAKPNQITAAIRYSCLNQNLLSY